MIEPGKIFNNLRVSGNLPAMPQILVQLIDSCHNQEIKLQNIARIANKDAAISAKILQLVNSAFTGARKAFTSLEQAVVYLGADTVRNLAISISVQQVFRRVETNGLLSVDRFWHHSYLNALLARKLAETTGQANPAEAYLAGLLHDIGKLLLWMAFPGKYAPLLLKGVRCHGARLSFLEEEKLQVNHCEAGAWFCEQWGLPSFLADAIRYHHHPTQDVAQALPLTKIISLADLLSHSDHSNQEAAAVAKLYFDLSPKQTKNIFTGIDEQITLIADELGIRIPSQAKTSHDLEPESEEVHKETALGLINRVRDISQLTGVLDSLLRAEDREQRLLALERGIKILFNEDACLVLLQDPNTKLLCGQASAENPLSLQAANLKLQHDRCRDSLIGQVLDNQQPAALVPSGGAELKTVHLLDAQLIRLLGTGGVAVMPMSYQRQLLGMLVVGMTEKSMPLVEQHSPLQMLAQQAAICFYLEHMQMQRAEQLAQERLQTAQLVARKIAHEINNPMAILQNYLRLLSNKNSKGESIDNELAIIESELERVNQLTLGLENLALEQTESVACTLDLHQQLDEIITLFKAALPRDNRIILQFQPWANPVQVHADPNRLRQILLNLLNNAKEAIAGAGQIEVGVIVHLDTVTVSVTDNGVGIDPTLQSEIFKAGSSTKDRRHGGIGLNIVHKLAKQMNGSINVHSQPGHTVFSLSLPA